MVLVEAGGHHQKALVVSTCPSRALAVDQSNTTRVEDEGVGGVEEDNGQEGTIGAASVSSPATNAMTAKAVLHCRPNSHPFQERTLTLDQPVKIGRSVARARPQPANAIFDCKVLSRNHALLWYENGKFFLQDTKSSNGTFVNNQRLSKGSEESVPREVSSGDIVQFGVDVMENSRKVTHGCIVATLKLFLPDGKEAKASPSTSVVPTSPGSISMQDLYQLAQCLQEALHREEMLENKLATLQRLMSNTDDTSESSWKALIDEDRLLTRLEILEMQLQAYSKNFSDDKLREEYVKLQEDKDTYQMTAKDSLKKVLQEKLDVVRKLQDAERSLNNVEEECVHFKDLYDKVQVELQEFVEKYDRKLSQVQELTERLQEYENKNKVEEEEEEENEVDKQENEVKSFTPDRGANETTQIEYELMKESITNDTTQVDLILAGLDDDLDKEIDTDIEDSQDDASSLTRKLLQSEKELQESRSKVIELTKLLEKAQVKAARNVNKVALLEAQLQEAKVQLECSNNLAKQLQEQVLSLEEELRSVQQEYGKNEATLTIIYKNEQNQLQSNGNVGGGHLNQIAEPETNHAVSLKTEIERLKELLAETRDKKKTTESEVLRFKVELEDARNNVKKAADDANGLRQQLQAARQQAKEKTDFVSKLQDQLSEAEVSAQDVKSQIAGLKDKLTQERQQLQTKNDEAEGLRRQLLDAQQKLKQSRNEVEQLKSKMSTMTTTIEVNAKDATTNGDSTSSIDEVKTLKTDCTILRDKITALQEDLANALEDKAKLMQECKKVMGNGTSLQMTSDAMSVGELEAVRSEVDITRKRLIKAQDEIVALKEKCAMYNDERAQLQLDLKAMESKGSQQTSLVHRLMIPLIMAGLLYLLWRW